jgi:hypothetical protein
VLGWQIVATPLLLQIKTLGSLREGLVGAAVQRLEPSALLAQGSPRVAMSVAAAVAAVVVWTLVPLALGAWRTVTRDA